MYLNLAAKRKNILFLQVVCCHYNSSKNVFSTKIRLNRGCIIPKQKSFIRSACKIRYNLYNHKEIKIYFSYKSKSKKMTFKLT
jgi:hypothetical protein